MRVAFMTCSNTFPPSSAMSLHASSVLCGCVSALRVDGCPPLPPAAAPRRLFMFGRASAEERVMAGPDYSGPEDRGCQPGSLLRTQGAFQLCC